MFFFINVYLTLSKPDNQNIKNFQYKAMYCEKMQYFTFKKVFILL